MNNQHSLILIAYPETWGCYDKFARKLSHILSQITAFSVVYPHDEGGFINKFFMGNQRVTILEETTEQVTHGIIFDDAISFESLKVQLNSTKTLLRCINVEISHVVNIDKQQDCDVYIGRGSGFGNPYAIGEGGDDRDEVIRKFKYDFDRDYLKDDFKRRLLKHRGKTLGCHCKPMSCHGDVLVEFLNSYDDGL